MLRSISNNLRNRNHLLRHRVLRLVLMHDECEYTFNGADNNQKYCINYKRKNGHHVFVEKKFIHINKATEGENEKKKLLKPNEYKLLKTFGSLENVVETFENLKINEKPTDATIYNILLQKIYKEKLKKPKTYKELFARRKRCDGLADKYVNEMKHDDKKLNFDLLTYSTLIKLYGVNYKDNAKKIDELLHDMDVHNVKRNYGFYSTLILTLSRAKMAQGNKIEKILEEMDRKNIKRTINIYNLLLTINNNLNEKKGVEKINEYMSEIKKNGLVPNLQTYYRLYDIYNKSEIYRQQSQHLLDEIIGYISSCYTQSPTEFDIRAYKLLACVWIEKKNDKEVFSVYKQIKQKISSIRNTRNSNAKKQQIMDVFHDIIQYFAVEPKNVELVEEMRKDIESLGFKPTKKTYVLLLQMYDSILDEQQNVHVNVHNIIDDIKKSNHFMPNNIMYNLIFSNAHRGKMYDLVQYYLEEIQQRMDGREAFKPNNELLATLHQLQSVKFHTIEEVEGQNEMASALKRWEERLNKERVLLKNIYLAKKPYRLNDEKIRDNRKGLKNSSRGNEFPFFDDVDNESERNGVDLVNDYLDDTLGVY